MSNLKTGDLVMFTIEIIGRAGKQPKNEQGVITEVVGDMCHIQSGARSYVRNVSAVTPMEARDDGF